MEQLSIHYSYGLVLVSVLISIISAYAAFSLAERTNSLEGEMRVGRSEVGTLVVARFPLERVLAS